MTTIQKSAVDFKGRSRFHLGLQVRNLDTSIDFYSKVFGRDPDKVRPGYAKFEVPEPSVNFTLNENPRYTSGGSLSHFGIQLKDTDQLEKLTKQFDALGMIRKTETQTSCCFAVQDKIWLHDPDDNALEFFVVLEKDAPPETAAKETAGCCGS